MVGAAGIAIRGAGKALLKGKVKPRGTPTKAGLVARRAALRGETTAEKYKKALGPTPKPTKRKTLKSEIERVKPAWTGLGLGIAGTLTVQEIRKKQKEVKAKEKEKKGKLKKATEEHEKKTKEKREKYGKHHG